MTFSDLLRDCWNVNRWKLPLLFGITFVSAALEGITLAALLPLLASLGEQATPRGTDHVSAMFDAVLASIGLRPTTTALGALVATLIVASACVYLAQAYVLSRLHAAYIGSWQRRLLTAFLEADFAFFRQRRTGDLVTSMTTESGRLGLGFLQANTIVTSILFIAIQAAIAMFVAPLIVGALAVLAGILFLITRPLASRALLIGRDLTDLNADLQSDASELLSGVKFVKATATESRALTRLATLVYHLQRVSFKNSFDALIVRAAFEYPGGLAMVGLIVAAPTLLRIDVSVVLVVVAMFVRLFPRISGLRQSMQILNTCLPALHTVSGLVADARRQTESVDIAEPKGWLHHGPAHIQIDHVSVTAEDHVILDDVTLDIPAGAFVAITGTTGSGKTTLLDCILRLRSPTTGKIFVDGFSLSDVPARSWRTSIGYLGQDAVLFNASVANNLSWVRPDVSPEELANALKAAMAEFAVHLPEGLDTRLGEHGSRLSGGERQRIALARALIGSPRALILDEATSALDSETEEAVTKALAHLRGKITILAITHRSALVREADFVININKGKAERIETAQALAG